jgi:hypothetical protein
MPSLPTQSFRSTRNQRGNCGPILATVRLYRILQLANAVGAGLALGAPLGLGLVVTVESVGAAGGVASSVIVGCKFDGTKDAFTSCARQLSASANCMQSKAQSVRLEAKQPLPVCSLARPIPVSEQMLEEKTPSARKLDSEVNVDASLT